MHPRLPCGAVGRGVAWRESSSRHSANRSCGVSEKSTPGFIGEWPGLSIVRVGVLGACACAFMIWEPRERDRVMDMGFVTCGGERGA